MKIEIRRTGLNGLKGKKLKPNRICWFETDFGSVWFKNLKKNNFDLVIYFDLEPDRTKNDQPCSTHSTQVYKSYDVMRT